MGRLGKYTDDARRALALAREEARRLRHRLVGTEHLLLGILRLNNPLVEKLFASQRVSTVSVVQALNFVVGRGSKALLGEPALNIAARAALVRAEEEAVAAQETIVGIGHMLLGIFDEYDGVAMNVLENFGLYKDNCRKQLLALVKNEDGGSHVPGQYQICYDTTPALNLVSRDLTLAALAGMLDPMIGREAELERTMQILSRRSKNNPVLIGPAGVGKTTIAEGLAQRIVRGLVPDNLRQCRVVALDVGFLTAGTKFRGDFEARLKRIMQEILTTSGIILVIDELHTLMDSGAADGSIGASNLFKPMLARGEFRCIGATTQDEYRKMVEADLALERRFQPVRVEEPSAGETLEILRGLSSHYASFHQVTISDAALLAAVQMSSRYIAGRYQPDKAIDLLDEAASHVCVQRSVAPNRLHQIRDEVMVMQREKDYAIAHRNFPQAAKLLKHERLLRRELWAVEHDWHVHYQQRSPIVGEQDIAEIVTMRTGIPVVQMADGERQRLMNLEEELHRRVIGQHSAVQAVVKAVRRSRANIRDSSRPIGSFIFVGPTGVGKTELAQALACALFGNHILKLDMSEFMESHHVSRLIGAPQGYVGYDQMGQLTEAIRRRPYSVVLFDEIEKAHPKIFDLLLQILEDGALTDSHGHRVDFKHTIIVMTSNVGTARLSQSSMTFTAKRQSEQKRRKSTYDYTCGQILPALKDLFKPELLNRVDEVVVFHALEKDHLREIVDLMVEQTRQRLAEQSIELRVTDAARLMLVEHGYDAEYGARPLRRTVQCMLEDMLAEKILHGTLEPEDAVEVDVMDGKLGTHILEPSERTTAVKDDILQESV